MAAPKGNQFWKLRSKHGRKKLFETPELMWEAACEYFQWCENNPFKENKTFHSNGKITKATEERMRPYTLEGLCLYLDANTAYFRQFKRVCSDDFSTVVRAIEDTIKSQQYSGAASDFLNPNIVARYLGLKDSQELSVESKEKVDPVKIIFRNFDDDEQTDEPND